MATLAFFHAHPDDETIATGGTMALLSSAGHRCILISATRGERGEVPEGFLSEGEELWQRREIEVAEACKLLGVARGEFLGYVDSGMMDTEGNDDPASFWQADLEEAAERLATILREENVDVLTVYDDHGGYGHPDHIQVHRVGVRAAELAGTRRVYESTIDRDRIQALIRGGADRPDGVVPEEAPDPDDIDTWGLPTEEITTRVDVSSVIDVKRAAMTAHASQIAESSFFLSMPPDMFLGAFGTEVFRRRDLTPGHIESSLLEGIES